MTNNLNTTNRCEAYHYEKADRRGKKAIAHLSEKTRIALSKPGSKDCTKETREIKMQFA